MRYYFKKGLFSFVNEGFGFHGDKTDLIIQYVKSFGKKGKLNQFDGYIRDFYKNDPIQKAYEWACESTDGVQREGFASFEHAFRTQVLSNFTINRRGLIYVERSIDLNVSDDFNELGFKSVGECWSWKKKNSRSYCSDNYLSVVNDNNVVTVVLCGYVHPESVDWVETIYTNSYHMKNEAEVRMNENALVEVSYIKIDNVKYPLGGSYLINASADKYRAKEW